MAPLADRQDSPDPAKLAVGRWAGGLDLDVAGLGSRRGRLRRWSYVAAADDHVAAGGAVIDLGYVVAAFVWVCRDGHVVQWERKGLPGRHGRVPSTAADGVAWYRRGTDRVEVSPDGTMRAEVGRGERRIEVDLRIQPDQPASVIVPTARGGWNATQKSAGETAVGRVSAVGWEHDLHGGAWRDYTVGRQDRDTSWRWAAGAGRSATRRVGLNASTGMNEHPPGENIVWWDGVPYPLLLTKLQPVGDNAGPWVLEGPAWALDFRPAGVRAADENLLLVRSRYVQPIGTFHGTLPGPDGDPVEVVVQGVTEDHQARW